MNHEKLLLEKIKQNDTKAFREIFNLYIGKIYSFICRYVKDKHEAEDLTQIVFQKLWENKASINLNKSFDGFIFTIAYHIIIDYIRQTTAKKNINTVEIMLDATFITDLSADDLINKHQFESLYQKALETLTDKRKEIFLLSRHEGLSNNAIAQKLNISIKTVENQMTAAIACIKEYFKKNEFLLYIFFILEYFKD